VDAEVTFEKTVDGAVAERFWDLYLEAFARAPPPGTSCVARSSTRRWPTIA
jgi:hypothetical protein